MTQPEVFLSEEAMNVITMCLAQSYYDIPKIHPTQKILVVSSSSEASIRGMSEK